MTRFILSPASSPAQPSSQAQNTSQAVFTLIELLVVLSIIGVLAGLLLTNFVGVRGRAADVRLKNDLSQAKKALRLYYNDYQQYPDHSSGTMLGCGSDGSSACTPGGSFSAGPDATVYMKELPATFEYYSDGSDQFLMVGTLQNASDTDIAASVNKCDPANRSYFGQTIAATDYFVCED